MYKYGSMALQSDIIQSTTHSHMVHLVTSTTTTPSTKLHATRQAPTP